MSPDEIMAALEHRGAVIWATGQALRVRPVTALDPTLAEAHAATGALLWRQLKLEDALTHLRHAVQINPNYVIAYVWMGNLLNFDLGRYEEAFQMRATAMRLDPLSIPTVVYYLQALIERHH